MSADPFSIRPWNTATLAAGSASTVDPDRELQHITYINKYHKYSRYNRYDRYNIYIYIDIFKHIWTLDLNGGPVVFYTINIIDMIAG